MTICTTAKPRHPRDDYTATLEHIWAYMRERAVKPHGTVHGMDTFEFEGKLPDVICELWPRVRPKEAVSMAAYIGTRLKLTQRVGVIESGTRFRLQRWWVADTYRPGNPAPEPAPIATPATASALVTRVAPELPPVPAAAQPVVPDTVKGLIDQLLAVAGAELRTQVADLTEEVETQRSTNSALRKLVEELRGDLIALADKCAMVLEISA